jgi:hypothetical protein
MTRRKGLSELVREQKAGGQARHRRSPNGQPHPQAGRPSITITVEEHEVNEQAVAALAADPSVFQRGGVLVRVVRDDSPAARGIRRPFAPRIDPLPAALLRERLAAAAHWIALGDKGGAVTQVPDRPPAWCVSAVHARGHWPGVRHLEAVAEYPVLRPDGTILAAPGYDPQTGLLLEPGGPVPPIPDRPSRDVALAASTSCSTW